MALVVCVLFSRCPTHFLTSVQSVLPFHGCHVCAFSAHERPGKSSRKHFYVQCEFPHGYWYRMASRRFKKSVYTRTRTSSLACTCCHHRGTHSLPRSGRRSLSRHGAQRRTRCWNVPTIVVALRRPPRIVLYFPSRPSLQPPPPTCPLMPLPSPGKLSIVRVFDGRRRLCESVASSDCRALGEDVSRRLFRCAGSTVHAMGQTARSSTLRRMGLDLMMPQPSLTERLTLA